MEAGLDSADGLAPTLSTKPTLVFVHGAFADGSSWAPMVAMLSGHCPYVIAANPLQGLESDAASLVALLGTISGPKVLVGHSYGGSVITEAAASASDVRALVYVSAFAPQAGETADQLVGRFPGSRLPDALLAASTPGGDADLYVRRDRYREVLAADLDRDRAEAAADSQRPVKRSAFDAPCRSPGWHDLPNWFIYGSEDQALPTALLDFMARRAGASEVSVIYGGSHNIHVSHPSTVLAFVERAAEATEFQVPNLDP